MGNISGRLRSVLPPNRGWEDGVGLSPKSARPAPSQDDGPDVVSWLATLNRFLIGTGV
jgi:hypothetical protein